MMLVITATHNLNTLNVMVLLASQARRNGVRRGVGVRRTPSQFYNVQHFLCTNVAFVCTSVRFFRKRSPFFRKKAPTIPLFLENAPLL